MIEVHEAAEFGEEFFGRVVGVGVRLGQQFLAPADDVTDGRDGVGGEVVLLAERADAGDERAGVARAAVEADDEREGRRVDGPAVVALDADGPAIAEQKVSAREACPSWTSCSAW